MLRPVYTEPENCKDCYRCIRECPVKAIRIEDNKASIIAERCVYCGHCTQICPTGAKKIRDGLSSARMVISRNPRKTYLSLDGSYVSEFGDVPHEALIRAARRLGFAGVSETALGAELVTRATEEFLASAPPSIYISSGCPVVVDYVRKYDPELIPCITPVVSPMIAHARMLRQLYGNDIKIVFAGPCIGRKAEADAYGDLVDVVITFRDLSLWFEREGIDLQEMAEKATEDDRFVPYMAGMGELYPVAGGITAGFKMPGKLATRMAFSDMFNITDLLDHIEITDMQESIFMELHACKGGCINGPGKLKNTSVALKRYDVVNKCERREPEMNFPGIDLSASFTAENLDGASREYPEYMIHEALAAIGKNTPADELNCSSCGYYTCREFAVAMIEGRAEDNMCASYMRKIAHDKASVLMQKIPAGIVIVNSELKIVDMNRNFAEAMGEGTLGIYDMCPGMAGSSLAGMCSFDELFRTAIATGEEIKERRVKEGDRTWLLSIFNIQPRRQVFGLLQDLQEPAVRKEWMVEKTREVIRNHMITVQKVAGLLGENAAYTDVTLRNILEAYDKGDEKEN